jgi:Helix-turn-helix domain
MGNAPRRNTTPHPPSIIRELAAWLQIHPVALYCAAKAGKIPGIKAGGRWRFSRDAFDLRFPKLRRVMKPKVERVRQITPSRWQCGVLCSEPGCNETGTEFLNERQEKEFEAGIRKWYCGLHDKIPDR